MKDINCITGACPTIEERDIDRVKLSEGSGGKEMQKLISTIQSRFTSHGAWNNINDDGASLSIESSQIVMTTDSYVVTPIFFPGGDIGKLAFCGTVNDLSVMGAKPLGISLSLVLEESLPKKDLTTIIETIASLSSSTKIPIVTGDTKVLEKGALDKIIINTTGIGQTNQVLDGNIKEGDHVIVSGGIGEHGTALLAKRFELETSIETDSKPLWEEIKSIKHLIKQAKDITRGGLAAILNELAEKNNRQLLIEEEHIPMYPEVRALTEILGIELYSLACEGRFACIAAPEKSEEVVSILKTFNPLVSKIGEMQSGKGVIVQTRFGKKILSPPSGNIVPRIC